MRKKLEARKLVLGNLLKQSKTATDHIKDQGEQLSVGIRPLLVAGKALSVARNQLQVICQFVFGNVIYFLKFIPLLMCL